MRSTHDEIQTFLLLLKKKRKKREKRFSHVSASPLPWQAVLNMLPCEATHYQHIKKSYLKSLNILGVPIRNI